MRCWYSFVSPEISLVTQDIDKINRLHLIHPYASFRRHETEEKALARVERLKKEGKLTTLKKYGNTFKDLYVTVKYFITEDAVYCNIYSQKFGMLDLSTTSKHVKIMNKPGLSTIKFDAKLNDDLIISHLIVIYNVLKILGPYIDVDFVIPDRSIFYALFKYTGSRADLRRVKEFIDSRLGEISVTIERW